MSRPTHRDRLFLEDDIARLRAEIERLRNQINSVPTPEAMLLQARKPGGEWINIFPAQLGWMAKSGLEVRALGGCDEQKETP